MVFFNVSATTEIYTLSLHDALPIFPAPRHFAERFGLIVIIALGESIIAIGVGVADLPVTVPIGAVALLGLTVSVRSEEHTSELQSRQYLVCRLLLEKKLLFER